ncbi:MAG: hypothetical protein ACFFD2_04745 [Promethearchaeota archaeon]
MILLFLILRTADRNGVLIKFVVISSTNDRCGAGFVGPSIFEIF